MFNPLSLTLAQESAPPAGGTPAPAPASPLAPATPANNTNNSTQAPAGSPPGGVGKPTTGSDSGFQMMMLVVLGLLVAMTLFSTRSQSKEKKKRASLLSALKKGDKVQTIGGELGTIVEVRDNEIILKVDENTNTRIRYARAAIQNVIEDKAE